MYRVVVIDDEFFSRKALIQSQCWERMGFEIVGEADDGITGLSVIKETSPDLIVVDIKMIQMDGIKMIQILREEGNNVKVIILTGYGEFSYAQAGIKYGVIDYILKPFKDSDLMESLRKVSDELKNSLEQEDKPKIIRDKKDFLIQEIKNYIKIHFAEHDLCIEKICSILNYNYHYISKIFKEREEVSLGKYIIQYRLNEAKKRIEQGEWNMEKVADEVGYDDVLYFMKSFKKEYDYTPAQYIKVHRNATP